jgi:hypothetical protein
MPKDRARKYRLIASEIRAAARTVSMEESRTSLLNLAGAYERMASAAEGAVAEPEERTAAAVERPWSPGAATGHPARD